MNKLTSDAAANALKNTATLDKNIQELLEQRELLAKQLIELDFVEKVYPSDANFLLFRVKQKANELYKTVSFQLLILISYSSLFVSLSCTDCRLFITGPHVDCGQRHCISFQRQRIAL